MRLLIVLLWIVVSINLGCNSEEDNSAATGNTSTTAGDTHDDDGDGHDHDGDDHDHDKKQATSDEHPAITVANQVLAAIEAGDAAAMKPLLNATNQEKVNDDEIAQYLKRKQETIGNVTKVTEVRGGLGHGLNWRLTPVTTTVLNQVMVKIRVAGDEVFVVVLTLEEGQYRFEDLNSPSVADYEAQAIVAP